MCVYKCGTLVLHKFKTINKWIIKEIWVYCLSLHVMQVRANSSTSSLIRIIAFAWRRGSRRRCPGCPVTKRFINVCHSSSFTSSLREKGHSSWIQLLWVLLFCDETFLSWWKWSPPGWPCLHSEGHAMFWGVWKWCESSGIYPGEDGGRVLSPIYTQPVQTPPPQKNDKSFTGYFFSCLDH